MIVLDTHAWFWWVTGSAELRSEARQRLSSERAVIVPSVALWELSLLGERGRLGLDPGTEEFLTAAVAWRDVSVGEITPRVATLAARLPRTFPGDPADRLIVATAMDAGCELVTRDRRIVASGLVPIVLA